MSAHRSSQPNSTSRDTAAIWALGSTVVLCVAMFVGLPLIKSHSDQSVLAGDHAAEVSPTQWEYARLRLANDVRWLTPGPRVRANSLGDLIERLGGKRPADKDDISPAEIVLAMAGADGWELVSHVLVQDVLFGGWIEVWTFKRPQ